VTTVTSGISDGWKLMGEELDDAVRRVIARAMFVLLHENADLKEILTDVDKTPLLEQRTPDLVSNLAAAIKSLKGSLLILVDEYDQPVRALNSLVSFHCAPTDLTLKHLV
jgi:hypothetical protein